MAYTAIRLFMDIDEVIFGRVIEDYKQRRLREKDERDTRVQNWKNIFQAHDPQALVQDESWKISSVPPAPAGVESAPPLNLTDAQMRSDPLLGDNDGLPLSVKIPHHMKQLVADDFDLSDPVFKELTELHQIQINKKLRRKEGLPAPLLTVEAMQQHVSLDDLAGEYNNYDTESDDYSSSYDSDEYSDGEGGGPAGGPGAGGEGGDGVDGGSGGGEGEGAYDHSGDDSGDGGQ